MAYIYHEEDKTTFALNIFDIRNINNRLLAKYIFIHFCLFLIIFEDANEYKINTSAYIEILQRVSKKR